MRKAMWCLMLALASCGGDSEPEEPLPEVTVEVVNLPCTDTGLTLEVKITTTRAVTATCTADGAKCTGAWGERLDAGVWTGELSCEASSNLYDTTSIDCIFYDAADGRYAEGQDWRYPPFTYQAPGADEPGLCNPS